MLNYYKYLSLNAEEENWGLQVLTAGCASIPPNKPYPSPGHPSDHYFNWETGRVLDDCYVVYIPQGKGYFQSNQPEPVEVESGTVMMLYPGQWHRYKPDESTGWEEYWVGFNGLIISDLIEKNYFQPSNPLLKVGLQDQLVRIFQSIMETVQAEKPGYQALACGAILYLLGSIHSLSRGREEQESDAEEAVIQKAKLIILSQIDQPLVPESVADELNVSYAWFRKAFKAATGLAPKQYILQLKMERAVQLLADPNKSIKEIAYTLNFESPFYFSSLFKKKIGLSPERYRTNMFKTD
ncbi:AraC family transcriptional regulator [Larkinella harenae]